VVKKKVVKKAVNKQAVTKKTAKKKAARPAADKPNAPPAGRSTKPTGKSPAYQPAAKGKGAGRTIKPPAAPALMSSPEAGNPLAQDQAIREKLRLYPHATTQEIVAMFELDGVRMDPKAVQAARRGM
jgi:hypothetical protein